MASYLCNVPLSMESWLCSQTAAVLVMWVSDELHQAYHTRGHAFERFHWFQQLRALHFWHHKGNMKHNYAISDFILDGMHGSVVMTVKDFDDRRRAGLA